MKTKIAMIRLSLVVIFSFLLINTPVPAAKTVQGTVGENKSTLSASHKVNINSADVATLTTLKGVGPQLAERIVEFRENNGPFKKVEDITAVKGVGTKILERNKNLIAIK